MERARYFGRSSEKRSAEAPPEQQCLFKAEPSPEAKPVEKERITYERKKRSSLAGKLPEGARFPEHLRRKDIIVDEGEGEVVFERVTERLAVNEDPYYVLRIIQRIRKKAGSLSAPAVPPTVLEKSAVDVSFLVYTVVAKYVWHLPLYRQEQILKSYGISISRDTLIRHVIAVASLLKPIYVALGQELFSASHLFVDETPTLVGKGKKGAKAYTESWFWTFLGEAGCLFSYAQTRAYKEIEPLLKTYTGHLQVDGYAVYDKLSQSYPEISLVSCWAHARRKFVEAEKGGSSPYATEALRYIRVLYRVESLIREKAYKPPDIVRVRRRYSRKILTLFESWLRTRASDPTLLPKSLFGKAVRYLRSRWETLTKFTDDASLAIDSNAVEREIRPVALGKKNWLFAASEAGAEASAILYSLIASCRLADVSPAEYLTDVLERISHHPQQQVAELVPIRWKMNFAQPATAATAHAAA